MASWNDSIFSLILFRSLTKAKQKKKQNTMCVGVEEPGMITVWAKKFRATSGPSQHKKKRSRPMLLAQSFVTLVVAWFTWIRACFSCFRAKKERFSFECLWPIPPTRQKGANGHHELSIPYRSRLGSLHDPSLIHFTDTGRALFAYKPQCH
jgi:hypothetical protein